MNTPEYHSASAEHEFAEHPEYSQIVGVFRDPSQAVEAVEELKQASFEQNKIQMTEYSPQESSEAEGIPLSKANQRFFVRVEAPGKEEEAVGILSRHGANNADLPPGTEMVYGHLRPSR